MTNFFYHAISFKLMLTILYEQFLQYFPHDIDSLVVTSIYTRPKKFLKSELFKKYLNHPTTQALFIDIIVMLYVSVISVHQIWDGIVPHE